ncbi:UDP-N-acetylmuramoyl-L-alanyl-D-glutamate--2,6-diaminopimelate ligase [Pilibacter termitis]|uniref:Lipid II isoglutaminyl synthase (glutamine-hydrolyzing) subunit MurT n=1 Tax=Pilibacter termitis TaxID=263852 RepID=A0A1T4Q0Z3_9ENTE|nr:Mur ligase family protein [Pilibacter termitis]SJZ97197.1 UDP-N-acetylmuramoyl-L-alanyl-D-glutamate--2,6-diaminopimelate ligase [Pilibacter termitis]
MTFKSLLATTVGKSAQFILKNFFKGGSSYPGTLALRLEPNILDTLARDYEVIVVTGTNGKTLTTALIVNILKQEFEQVLTNPTGANMIQGIVSTFLSAKTKKGQKKFAVLEIDEASLAKVTEYIQPKLFVFTNIFRDQMDRYGEIYTTYDYILKGAEKSPEGVILANGDSPLFHSVETKNPRKYYGFDHKDEGVLLAHYNTEGILCPKCQGILHYHMITYANLGNYFCPNCDFARPTLDYKLTELLEMTNTSAKFVIDKEQYGIEVGGMYNIYNALAAASVAEYYGVSAEKIRKGLGYDEKVFGRQETFEIDGKHCTLVLVKNPVGTNQVIDMIGLTPNPFTLVSLLNANYADGIDTSWIWDANYELFASMDIKKVIAGGVRHEEMERRLRVAGLPKEKLVEVDETFERLKKEIQTAPTDSVYILATYTAVLNLRKDLATNGYIKNGY